MFKIIAVAVLLSLPAVGYAQIYKCTSETGTTIISEIPCADDAEIVPEYRLNVNVHDRNVSTPSAYVPPRQAPESSWATTPPPPPSQAVAARKPDPYEINTRYDNLLREVRGLYSGTKQGDFTDSIIHRKIERQRSRALAAQSMSDDFQSINIRFDNLRREAKSSTRLGSRNQNFARISLANRLVSVEASRDAALYGVSSPASVGNSKNFSSGGLNIPSPPTPSVITNCDSAGCWDNVGNRYNRGAGDTFFGPTGACQQIGNMMQCP